MELITYIERATVIYYPDGTSRGSEAHVHTGYFEERDVPDAPGGKQQVFVVIKSEVRPIENGDLRNALDAGCSATEDAAVKAVLIAHLQDLLEDTGDKLIAAEQRAETRAQTIAEQTAWIAGQTTELAEAAKREGEMRKAVQQLTRENGAMAAELASRDAELAALREAAAQEAAAVE